MWDTDEHVFYVLSVMTIFKKCIQTHAFLAVNAEWLRPWPCSQIAWVWLRKPHPAGCVTLGKPLNLSEADSSSGKWAYTVPPTSSVCCEGETSKYM